MNEGPSSSSSSCMIMEATTVNTLPAGAPTTSASAAPPPASVLALATLPCLICAQPLARNLPLATVPCGASFHKACFVSAATPVSVSPASTPATILSALGVNVGKPPPSFTCPAVSSSDSDSDAATAHTHTHLGDPSDFGSDVVLSDVVDKVAELLAPYAVAYSPPHSPGPLKRCRASTDSLLGEDHVPGDGKRDDGGDYGHDDKEADSASTNDLNDASDARTAPSSFTQTDSHLTDDAHDDTQKCKHVAKAPRLDSPASSSTASLVAAVETPEPFTLPYSEFEDLLSCPLCYHQLHDPVTLSPCGHTACRPCLLRTLDHSANARAGQFRCFVCRKHLWGSYVAYLTHAPNKTLEHILAAAFPDQVRARKTQLEMDELNATAATGDDAADGPPVELHNVPLFVCNLALPGQRVPLHIFEPRYRLMLRRVTAPGGSRQFGMLHYTRTPAGGTGIPMHGTMLHVDHVDFLPDGRSLVETSGKFVFRLSPDSDVHTGDGGYLVARRATRVVDSEYLAPDDPVPGEVADVAARLTQAFPHVLGPATPSPPPFVTVAQFTRLCAAATEGFLAVVPAQYRAGARAQIGQAPLDRPEWLGYWLTGTLPLPESVQYRVLEEASPRQRLVMAVQWMDQVRRVDSRGPIGVVAQMVGCSIM